MSKAILQYDCPWPTCPYIISCAYRQSRSPWNINVKAIVEDVRLYALGKNW